MAEVRRPDERDDDEEIIDAVEDTNQTDEVEFDEDEDDDGAVVDLDMDEADPDEATVTTTTDAPTPIVSRGDASDNEATVADDEFEIVEEVIEEVVIVEEVADGQEDAAPSSYVSSARPDEPMPLSESYPSTPLPSGGVRRRSASPASRRQAPRGNQNLKAFATPIVGVVGLLLLVPAVWALLLLTESDLAWGTDRPNAVSMAKLMLVCWPLALTLLAASAVMFVQVQRGRRAAEQKHGRD